MGVLVGILIGFSRLAADSEITAMRASGIGVWTFLRIISIFVIVAWLLALVNGVYMRPDPKPHWATSGPPESLPGFFRNSAARLLRRFSEDRSVCAGREKRATCCDLEGRVYRRYQHAASANHSGQEGTVASESPDTLHLHLTDGSTHETDSKNPATIRFRHLSRPTSRFTSSAEKKDQEPVPVAEMNTGALLDKGRTGPKFLARWFLIEFHRRLALPTACLVLALVGIPLGLSSKKRGKSTGFVLTILLVFAYYVDSLVGVSLARQGKLRSLGRSVAGGRRISLRSAFSCCGERSALSKSASFRASWKRET